MGIITDLRSRFGAWTLSDLLAGASEEDLAEAAEAMRLVDDGHRDEGHMRLAHLEVRLAQEEGKNR